MSSVAIPPVGERIREERRRRGLTLRQLARDAGVSASLISQIETGKSRPSVSTLYNITQALHISIEDVFDAGKASADEPVLLSRFERTVAAAGEASAGQAVVPDAVRRVGPLVRPPERDVLELDSGVTWQRLGRVPGMPVDFLLITYAPSGTSSSDGRLMRHSGVEYGYLIQGSLTLTLGFEEYRLVPGDAVCFPSSTPHRYRNEGDVPAIGVWFVDDRD